MQTNSVKRCQGEVRQPKQKHVMSVFRKLYGAQACIQQEEDWKEAGEQ